MLLKGWTNACHTSLPNYYIHTENHIDCILIYRIVECFFQLLQLECNHCDTVFQLRVFPFTTRIAPPPSNSLIRYHSYSRTKLTLEFNLVAPSGLWPCVVATASDGYIIVTKNKSCAGKKRYDYDHTG